METNIAGYHKTEHFLLRQWERNVNDNILLLALNRVERSNKNFLLIISRDFIKRYCKEDTPELFIKIKGRQLVTCYYAELASQMRENNNESYCLIDFKIKKQQVKKHL